MNPEMKDRRICCLVERIQQQVSNVAATAMLNVWKVADVAAWPQCCASKYGLAASARTVSRAEREIASCLTIIGATTATRTGGKLTPMITALPQVPFGAPSPAAATPQRPPPSRLE